MDEAQDGHKNIQIQLLHIASFLQLACRLHSGAKRCSTVPSVGLENLQVFACQILSLFKTFDRFTYLPVALALIIH